VRALRGAEVLVAVMLTRSCRNLTRAPAAAFPAACFFLEQGTLDYITRLEESTAAASASCCREHEAVDVQFTPRRSRSIARIPRPHSMTMCTLI